MADKKVPAVPAFRAGLLPSILDEIGRPGDMPSGDCWPWIERYFLDKKTEVVGSSTALLDAKRRQSDAYTALIDSKMRITRKIAELADLPNLIAEEQREREHARWKAEQERQASRTQFAFNEQHAAARHAVALAQIGEAAVRAGRNLEAARRVKDAQLDQWYAEAQARTNNAKAEFDDTVADLGLHREASPTTGASDAAAVQKARDFAVLDDQIELERQRGNEAAAMALLNLRARLASGGTT